MNRDRIHVFLCAMALLLVGMAGTVEAGFYDELGIAVCIPQSPDGKPCLFIKGISDMPNPLHLVDWDDFSDNPNDWSREKLLQCRDGLQKSMKEMDVYLPNMTVTDAEGNQVATYVLSPQAYDRLIARTIEWYAVEQQCFVR